MKAKYIERLQFDYCPILGLTFYLKSTRYLIKLVNSLTTRIKQFCIKIDK